VHGSCLMLQRHSPTLIAPCMGRGLTGHDASVMVLHAALQAAYERYGPYGFVVLGFPCNQFKQQESRPEKYIKEFAQKTYNVSPGHGNNTGLKR
jgi:hypothetical protein